MELESIHAEFFPPHLLVLEAKIKGNRLTPKNTSGIMVLSL